MVDQRHIMTDDGSDEPAMAEILPIDHPPSPIRHGKSAAEHKVLRMVAVIRWRWLALHAGRLAIIGLAGLLTWLLVAVVLDNVVMFSSELLLSAWALAVMLTLAWVAMVVMRMGLHRPNGDALAKLYESSGDRRGNRLINALQMITTGRAEQEPMAMAVIIENAQHLQVADAGAAVDWRAARRPLIAMLVIAALFTGYAALRPAWMHNALVRLIHPMQPAPHLLATDIFVQPGDAEIIEGQPFEVSADLTRNIPDEVFVEYRVGALQWQRDAMTRTDDDTFRFAGFTALWHPMQYRIIAGRSTSATYHVSLKYHPRIEALQVKFKRPSYTGAGETFLKENVGDVATLTGSSVTVQVDATRELAEAVLEMHDGTTIPMTVESHRAEGSFTLMANGSYVIRLTDSDGLTNIKPPRYTLAVETDQPPLVIVTNPGRDLILPVDAEIDIAVEAQDDYGLAVISLETNRGDLGWQQHGQWDEAQIDTRHRVRRATLNLAALGAQVGDTLLYRAHAADRREPTPGVGTGRTWSITVTESMPDESLLADQTRRLLEALRHILEIQQDNRKSVDMDREPEPITQQQQRIRELTLGAIATYEKSVHPSRNILRELVDLADTDMMSVLRLLEHYHGDYAQRVQRKKPVMTAMDRVIERLEALIGKVDRAADEAQRATQVLDQMPGEEKEKALESMRAMLQRLRSFAAEQDRVIEDTEELARKGEDFTKTELERIEKLKGTEDRWADVFTDSVADIKKLTEQGFVDATIANDYKEMIEQIEAASLNLTPELIEMAVPRELSGRILAESIAEEMEMWLPNSPDHLKWMMEEPLDFPDIPMPELPDQLFDFIGDLIEEQDALNDMAEDMTSAWADSLDAAGWAVMDGPISNFSAVGKTGNQLPDDHELSGRSGEGRSGRSQGQMVEDTAKGLGGRQTPTRVTNDAYEEGVVRELQQMATGGSTGGGKARGSGQEGLQGMSPPPLARDMEFMREAQQKIRSEAQRVAGQLRTVRLNMPQLERAIELMDQVDNAAADGRYADMFQQQQMVLQQLKMAGDLAARDVAVRIDRAYHLPADQRREVLDAMDEPVPSEYEDAVRRYFLKLSESP
jgi:hypothetical protein